MALFAGAGGGILAGKLLGWNLVCAVENNAHCQRVLAARMRDGSLPEAPIWDDIKTFDGNHWRGRVDVISAGFPCQPFSVAGRQQGDVDERNLWPETIRVVREVGPRYVFLENSSNLLTFGYFGRILADLAQSGYDARWDCLPASAVGANHERDRLWIVAYSAEP